MKTAPLLLVLLLSGSVQAASVSKSAGPQVVLLANGPNALTLAGQGAEVMVVLAHRENFNAHSFEIASFFIRDADTAGRKSPWNAITLFDAEDERFVLTVSGGADCVLHDFRLLSDPGAGTLTLVKADRPLGDGFAEPNDVSFSFYELRTNKTGEIGRPQYFFERTRVRKAAKKYCDVGDALQAELGLDDYRKGGQ